MEQVPSLLEQLAVKPFELRTTELEISAYNDGAFFRRHIDTVTGVGGLDSHRIVSGVLYLHGQPRRFEGGELRIFPYGAFDAAGDEHLDVQPSANSCVFFPSWAPHEVRPVRCPSGQFQDSRFAINIWLKGRP